MANVLTVNSDTNINGNNNMLFGAPGSLFNLDGSKPGTTTNNENNNNLGGTNMGNLTGAWTKDNGANTSYDSKNPNATDWNMSSTQSTNNTTATTTGSGFQVAGSAFSANTNATQTKNVSPSGANWGDSAPVTGTFTGSGTYDKSGIAIQAIKDLAGKLMGITNSLNTEEFNTFVKIFDFAGLKDEFLARSGRRDSYLDRELLVQAINEANMVFNENNQKNQNIINALQNIGNTLETTGAYDAANIYKFVLDCVNSGAIPASIQNDNMRQNLNRVIRMALAYQNNGNVNGVSPSGANWGTGSTNNNGGAWNGWGDTTNWSGAWSGNNNNNNNGGPSTSSVNWGMNSGNSYNQSISWPNAGNNNNQYTDPWVSTPGYNQGQQGYNVNGSSNPYSLADLGFGAQNNQTGGSAGFDWNGYKNNNQVNTYNTGVDYNAVGSSFNPLNKATFLNK